VNKKVAKRLLLNVQLPIPSSAYLPFYALRVTHYELFIAVRCCRETSTPTPDLLSLPLESVYCPAAAPDASAPSDTGKTEKTACYLHFADKP
jgi:hypothetical protein